MQNDGIAEAHTIGAMDVRLYVVSIACHRYHHKKVFDCVVVFIISFHFTTVGHPLLDEEDEK